ncbi:hypothetical protein HCH_03152 [Hahella chejuensis KCTC 2396]|uniref:Uncharacterized protein n=1 Tax=Hahella chejuensis (strain KCTC 2396) TaxID=349521 RepID=Q2SHF9_HAHCH|nr:hypothetical protein HCH_03152 [Hahella chejuensis KCTC 2396]
MEILNSGQVWRASVIRFAPDSFFYILQILNNGGFTRAVAIMFRGPL